MHKRAETPKATPQLADLLRVPQRFLRSTHLERDLPDPHALDGYVWTPFIEEAFRRVLAGLDDDSRCRAWRITGDYGVGKSTFALLLAQTLAGTRNAGPNAIHPTAHAKQLLAIVVTASRTRLSEAVAQGIADAIRGGYWGEEEVPQLLVDLATKAVLSGKIRDLEEVIDHLRGFVGARGKGICFVLDELGKALEYAAFNPDNDDIIVLQRLAEIATRSGANPFLFVVLLHQGFVSYASRLPSNRRNEWEKVAGRFEELVFSQPLMHSAMLVSSAFNLDQKLLDKGRVDEERASWGVLAAAGWLGRAPEHVHASLFPLHPTVLPVLVRFFSRFGQNERSLFSFLLSQEPHGVQAGLQRPADRSGWYRLPDLYDYVRVNYGFRLAGESHRGAWSRIAAILDSAIWASQDELDVLKTVGLLNLLDADDLRPLDAVIADALVGEDIAGSIAGLVATGVLFRRGRDHGLRLWSGASIDLGGALEIARTQDVQPDSVAFAICSFLESDPVVARRHYVETGTLRYFNMRFATIQQLTGIRDFSQGEDGQLVFCVTQSESEQLEATELAISMTADNPKLIFVLPAPVKVLSSDLQDVRLWRWVLAHTPELSQDQYALHEVERQLALSTEILMERLSKVLPQSGAMGEDWRIYWEGAAFETNSASLSSLVSTVCDKAFPSAPLVRHELLNRSKLSSAGAAARMRLVERIFSNSAETNLGFPAEKAPPERSMYFSFIKEGRMHEVIEGQLTICEPALESDHLRLRPTFDEIHRVLADGERVSVPSLLEALVAAPFGIREGLAGLILAVFLAANEHHVAVFERGNYQPIVDGSVCMRLLRQGALFELQQFRIAGVRETVFRKLRECLLADTAVSQQDSLLSVVRHLVTFYGALPEATKKTTDISVIARRVRDCLSQAREPASLIFRQLPEACGIPAITLDREGTEQVNQFVEALVEAMSELRNHYFRLVERLRSDLFEALLVPLEGDRRREVAHRAVLLLDVALESRLLTFALRLNDTALADDKWIEALATVVIGTPPSRWGMAEVGLWKEEIWNFGNLFRRVESIKPMSKSDGRLLVSLTTSNGEERKVMIGHDQAPENKGTFDPATHLPKSRPERIQLLTQLLWHELDDEK